MARRRHLVVCSCLSLDLDEMMRHSRWIWLLQVAVIQLSCMLCRNIGSGRRVLSGSSAC